MLAREEEEKFIGRSNFTTDAQRKNATNDIYKKKPEFEPSKT